MGEANRKKPIGICWICGHQLRDAMGKPVNGVELQVGGNPVRAHKTCLKREQRIDEIDEMDANLRAMLEKRGTFSGRHG